MNAILPNGSVGNMLQGYIYRGEGSADFKLLPSALRTENIEKLRMQDGFRGFKLNDTEWLQIFAEYRILRKFYKIANDNGLKVHASEKIAKHYYDEVAPEFLFDEKDKIWVDPELLELAALAQHYGVITRMLDWTDNLFIALYFSCIGGMNRFREGKEDKIVVWALNAKELQVNEQLIYTCGKDDCPLKLVVPSYYSNPNLKAQHGVLSYWRVSAGMKQKGSVNRTPLNELIEDIHGFSECSLYKFVLTNKYAPDLYKLLQRFGYNAASIYPGYNGVVKKMQEDNLYVEIIKKETGVDILGTYHF